jgi:multiple sugar transport system ATP-binding protein
MARVVIEDLVKVYPQKNGPDVRAVRGINLTVADGEFMVLVGPSGCGKSTTLRMIAGLEEISGGRISIDDRVVNDVAPKDRDIAMVFQNYALYPHLSVYENLAFSLKLRKLPKREIDERVRAAAALLGLEACLGRKPRALSGGQRQRVAVGRAMVRQPKVFLFDEPLSNLDAQMRGTMRTELSKLHARLHATMIYVTHDQMEAMTMGDRICVLKDGDIQQVDEPLAIYHHPANLFVAGFIGSPGMNFFPGALLPAAGQEAFVTDFAEGTVPLTLNLPAALRGRAGDRLGQPLVLGLRPEDLHVTPESGPPGALEAEIEVAEPMGAETYLYLRCGGRACVARVRSEERYLPGQKVRLRLDLARAHLFEAATGRALYI